MGGGKAIWRGAKALGGGSATQAATIFGKELPYSQQTARGLGVIGGTTLAAGMGIPAVIGGASKSKQEMMTPWQGQRTML